MAEQITRAIRFKSQKNSESNSAKMYVIIFTQQEQKMRALKSMMIFWAIAALCILIPIAHFILVPGFFIGGIVAASRHWKIKEEGIEATGSCPACHNGICIKLDKNAELPQWKDCPECTDPLELQAAPENR
ncbi:MAG: hypothetical protein BMS9Abin18_0461 [Zetaproteobacteria bacterium]|nr:MAG: hypothetical protein BMS9Abin18_0461 [Zetaproteobacteria bacterium]